MKVNFKERIVAVVIGVLGWLAITTFIGPWFGLSDDSSSLLTDSVLFFFAAVYVAFEISNRKKLVTFESVTLIASNIAIVGAVWVLYRMGLFKPLHSRSNILFWMSLAALNVMLFVGVVWKLKDWLSFEKKEKTTGKQRRRRN